VFVLATAGGTALSAPGAPVAFIPMAHATVGGPATVSPLGYEASTGRVFVLRHEANTELLPVIQVLDARGRDGSRLVLVCGWRGDVPRTSRGTCPVHVTADRASEKLERRVARLRERLTPLSEIDRRDYRLTSRLVAPTSWHDPSEDVDVPGRRLHVTVSSQRRRAAKTHVVVTSFREGAVPRVASAWAIPGGSTALVVVRHFGIPYEGAYEDDRPLLVR
jgi:hypothetical protein